MSRAWARWSRFGQLRRPPGRPHSPLELIGQLVDRDALLPERVAVADGDRAVLQRLVVDRDRERRADLVLAPVATADRAALVVLRGHTLAHRRVHLAGDLRLAVLAHQGQDGDLHRRELRMQPQQRARLTLDLLFVVGVDEEGERGAVRAGRRLDHMRHVALAGRLVEVLELLAGELRVLAQVEVPAVGDPLELLPVDREQVLDVARGARVMRELVGAMGTQTQVVGADAEIGVPAHASVAPVVEPRVGLVRRDEVLELHLLELPRPEDEVAGGDLVAEGLADLRDSERRLLAGELQDVLEVDEDALRGLRSQIGDRPGLLHRADRRLEHEVEFAGLSQIALRALAGVDRGLARTLCVLELVGPEALAARPAVHQRVGEAGQVARRLPRARVHDDRGVERHDVVALAQHRVPPAGLDVVLQENAVVAVVVCRADPAVDLRGGEDEAAALAQRDDLVYGHDVVRHEGGECSPGTALSFGAMPIYEYRCDNGHTFEVLQRMTDDPMSVCQTCDAPVQRVFHPVAVHFKGSGFYNTDYGTRNRKRELESSAKEGADKTESKAAEKKAEKGKDS